MSIQGPIFYSLNVPLIKDHHSRVPQSLLLWFCYPIFVRKSNTFNQNNKTNVFITCPISGKMKKYSFQGVALLIASRFHPLSVPFGTTAGVIDSQSVLLPGQVDFAQIELTWSYTGYIKWASSSFLRSHEKCMFLTAAQHELLRAKMSLQLDVGVVAMDTEQLCDCSVRADCSL